MNTRENEHVQKILEVVSEKEFQNETIIAYRKSGYTRSALLLVHLFY